MDAEVNAELKAGSSGLSVITRHGSPSELSNMDRVASGTARRIIVLPHGESGSTATGSNPNAAAQQSKAEQATGLALALQRGVTRKPEERASVVVTAPKGYQGGAVKETSDGFKSYAEVNPSDYISRILAQCAVQPALADVYAELLLQ